MFFILGAVANKDGKARCFRIGRTMFVYEAVVVRLVKPLGSCLDGDKMDTFCCTEFLWLPRAQDTPSLLEEK